MKGGIIHMRDIKELESFDISPNHIINSKFIFNNREYLDYNWMERQIEYINNLSDRQKHIIRAYTIYGDKFINNYLRNSLTTQLIYKLLDECKKNNENPFLYQHYDMTKNKDINDIYKENIIKYIELFIKEFNKIIEDSPRLNKKIKVFRGLENGNFIVNSLKRKEMEQYMITNDYMSSSIYLASATNFMKGDCCLLELYIEPNTPCLFTAHMSRRRNEYEITFMPNMKMRYIKCTRKYVLDEIEHYKDYEIFLKPQENSVRIIRMCEFVITSH
jgi:hypothetical protein